MYCQLAYFLKYHTRINLYARAHCRLFFFCPLICRLVAGGTPGSSAEGASNESSAEGASNELSRARSAHASKDFGAVVLLGVMKYGVF